jgi:transcriptional regulator with XRE-family HTH domain
MNFWIDLRKRLHLTRYSIAKQLGLRQGSWDNLEQEGGRPTLELLVKLKRLSDRTGNELFAIMEEFHGEKPKGRKGRKPAPAGEAKDHG